MDRYWLYIAQGFGTGRFPFAPGTMGSFPGLVWFGVLLATGSLWGFFGGALIGVMFSVWVCGRAEKILRMHDPGSVVMDEITAVPLCFAYWVVKETLHQGKVPGPDYFLLEHWPMALFVFVAFRIFDALKPFPINKCQDFPGGWGVTADDVAAAVCVNVVTVGALAIPALSGK